MNNTILLIVFGNNQTCISLDFYSHQQKKKIIECVLLENLMGKIVYNWESMWLWFRMYIVYDYCIVE